MHFPPKKLLTVNALLYANTQSPLTSLSNIYTQHLLSFSKNYVRESYLGVPPYTLLYLFLTTSPFQCAIGFHVGGFDGLRKETPGKEFSLPQTPPPPINSVLQRGNATLPFQPLPFLRSLSQLDSVTRLTFTTRPY